MPQVLTTNALILCPHGGKGTSIPTSPIWTVNGGAVLVENDTGTLACPFVLCPCIGYKLSSMGLNATMINGRRVILATDFNQTFTGLPLIITEFHQTFDNTTPASLPAAPGPPARPGEGLSPATSSSPPLSPDMLDSTKPTVVAAPPVLAFNSMTMMPPVLTVVFTIVTAFPLKWILTLLNGVARASINATNGAPPGLIVAPPGGLPSPVVTMTLTAPFMAALGPGMHYFYLTAVSRRGLSGFGQAVLTVT
jgi:hypothetical protein